MGRVRGVRPLNEGGARRGGRRQPSGARGPWRGGVRWRKRRAGRVVGEPRRRKTAPSRGLPAAGGVGVCGGLILSEPPHTLRPCGPPPSREGFAAMRPEARFRHRHRPGPDQARPAQAGSCDGRDASPMRLYGPRHVPTPDAIAPPFIPHPPQPPSAPVRARPAQPMQHGWRRSRTGSRRSARGRRGRSTRGC